MPYSMNETRRNIAQKRVAFDRLPSDVTPADCHSHRCAACSISTKLACMTVAACRQTRRFVSILLPAAKKLFSLCFRCVLYTCAGAIRKHIPLLYCGGTGWRRCHRQGESLSRTDSFSIRDCVYVSGTLFKRSMALSGLSVIQLLACLQSMYEYGDVMLPFQSFVVIFPFVFT